MLTKFFYPEQTEGKTPSILTVHQQEISKDTDSLRHPVANSVICEKDYEDSTLDLTEHVTSSSASWCENKPITPHERQRVIGETIEEIFSHIFGHPMEI